MEGASERAKGGGATLAFSARPSLRPSITAATQSRMHGTPAHPCPPLPTPAHPVRR